MNTVETVVVILKIAERCNINCTYCYFFNGIDQSYKEHSKKIALTTVEKIADYFINACQQHKIKTLRFDFHGGEPLLVNVNYFDKICKILLEKLGDLTHLEFSLQTNAMLINSKWIELFNKYKINIGISIDGPEEYHNKYRINHQGEGTYQETKNGIELIREYYYKKQVNFGVAALCVINPEFSGRVIYRHFVDDLKLNSFDFILPDNTWDSIKDKNFSAEDYGQFLSDVFSEWLKDDNPSIFVRIIHTIMSSLHGKRFNFHDFGGWLDKFLLITISSNGDIGPEDTYRSISPELMQTGLTVYNSNFRDLLNHETIKLLKQAANEPVDACKGCQWVSFCKGGSLMHRYASASNFNNQSVYCAGLKIIYKNVYDFLKSHNVQMAV